MFFWDAVIFPHVAFSLAPKVLYTINMQALLSGHWYCHQ